MRVLVLMLLWFLPVAWGHEIEQVYVRLTLEEDRWVGKVDLDSQMVAEIAAGKNLEDVGTNEWFAGLSEEEAREFFAGTKGYWRERFVLEVGGEECIYTMGLPDPVIMQRDVRTSSPLEKTLIPLTMEGRYPAAGGPVEVTWKETDEEEPYLVVGLRVAGKGGSNLVLVDEGMPVKLGERSGPEGGEEVETTVEAQGLWAWMKSGFEHILPKGLDHILFVLGLFLLAPKWKPLLAQSAAFTVAHSITLGLVVTGVFSVSSAIVEPLIALSIAYVALENLFVKELKPWRLALVFGLGLLHGMGFAGVMQELDLPEGQILQPLLGFNVGVELGQVAVLALAFLATGWCLRKERVWGGVRMVSSLLIGLAGIYWTVERLMA